MTPGGAVRGERGSALVLAPFALLVIVLLAALCIDGSLAFVGQRELADLAGDAADDAVSAIDLDAFYGDEGYRIDPSQAERIAQAVVAAHDDAHVRVLRIRVTVPSDETVRVALDGEVPLVFAPAVPGAPGSTEVHAVAIARALRR